MTDNNKTLIAALLDRSGSMVTSKAATEEGFNALIVNQAKEPGQALVTLAQFDSHYGNWPQHRRPPNVFGGWPPLNTGDPVKDDGYQPEYVYEFKDITSVPKLVIDPRGGTPLIDALGNFVVKIGKDLAKMREQDRPSTVIVVVMTDGEENQSRSWTKEKLKALIEQQESAYKWRFIFLGANMDAVATAESYGFQRGSSITYDDSSPVAVAAAMASTSNMVSSVRGGNLSASYSSEDRSRAVGK